MTDYGAIADETIKQKYEITKGMYGDTDEILDDFYRNTLKNRAPDRITFESDRPRENHFSKTKLNLLHSGKLSDVEPYQPEIFLGFTEKDPRGHIVDPDLRKYNEQMWHRTSNYDKVFSSDADPSIPSEGVNEVKKIKDIRNAQFAGKKYRKIFSTSLDGMHIGYNGLPDSKPIGEKIENTNSVMDLNDIDNIAKRRDWTTTKSFETPLGYLSTPDHKFKIAKYGKKGKNPDIYDTRIIENKKKIERDAKELVEYKDNLITKALVLTMKDIINDRKKNQDPSLNAQILGISNNTQYRKNNNNKKNDKTDESKNLLRTHKKAKLMEEMTKNIGAQVDKTDVIKNKQEAKNDIITGPIHQSEIANKTSANIEAFINNQLMDKILHSHDINATQGNNKKTNIYSHIKPQLCEMMNKTKKDTQFENNKIQKRDPESYKFYKYNNKLPEDSNVISKNKEGYDEKAVIKKSTDKNTQNRNTAQLVYENNNKNNLDTEMAYVQNGTKNKKTGKKIKRNMINYMNDDRDDLYINNDKEQIRYSKK